MVSSKTHVKEWQLKDKERAPRNVSWPHECSRFNGTLRYSFQVVGVLALAENICIQAIQDRLPTRKGEVREGSIFMDERWNTSSSGW